MNYWMVCLPRADMEHCIRIGIFGRGSARTISEVKEGDLVVCVVTKEKRLETDWGWTSDQRLLS